MPDKRKLVVIGAGMAGTCAVEEILARGGGEQFYITVFADEPEGNYSRTLLPTVLAGSASEEQIIVHPPAWYAEHNIRLHCGESAAGLDRRVRVAYGEDGRPEPFDKLIIATGSRPWVPLMAGTDKPGVFVLRTLGDCRQISRFSRSCWRAAVIGGGTHGVEVARGLNQLGLDVTIVHIGGHLMDAHLDAHSGMLLRGELERLGIRVLLNRQTRAILGASQVRGLRFVDDATLDCELVVIAAGVRPNWEIAAGCGLTVERGIVVDDFMRSVDDADIYAVGECAQPRVATCSLPPAPEAQARILAAHVLSSP